MRKCAFMMSCAVVVCAMSAPGLGMPGGDEGEGNPRRAPSSPGPVPKKMESELMFDDPLQHAPEIPACLRSKNEDNSDGVLDEFLRMTSAIEKHSRDLEIMRRLSQELREEARGKDSLALARLGGKEDIDERFKRIEKRIEKKIEEEARHPKKRVPSHMELIPSNTTEGLIPLLVADNDLKTNAQTPQ